MNNGRRRPLALVILDGWGHSPHREGNAIALAHTPNYDGICERYPTTFLAASGARIGLAPNAPGNSEVGHLTLGAGRVVRTDVARINAAVRDGSFFSNPVLCEAMEKAGAEGARLHLIGLISDADIHSIPDNLFALLRMARNQGLTDVFVHGILDGRDVQPRTADIYAEAFEIKMADIGVGRFATLCGRHYAMDREGAWERTARVYTMLVHGEGERAVDAVSAVRSSFLRGITDEFIQPIVLEKEGGEPVANIRDGDVVIYFNHRGDRLRQLVKSLSVRDESDPMTAAKPKIHSVCLTEYDRDFNLPAAFAPEGEKRALAEIFEENEIRNVRVSETEKQSLVTHFFNGGFDSDRPIEKHAIVPSLAKNSREVTPEMSCFKVTDAFLRALEKDESDVFVVNLAAADMVAHTGNLERTIESVQYIDTCIGGIVDKVRELGGVAIITADHGNIEVMRDAVSGEPFAGHTINPVPFHLVDDDEGGIALRGDGALDDVAPTILGLLGIEKPAEMTGRDLRVI